MNIVDDRGYIVLGIGPLGHGDVVERYVEPLNVNKHRYRPKEKTKAKRRSEADVAEFERLCAKNMFISCKYTGGKRIPIEDDRGKVAAFQRFIDSKFRRECERRHFDYRLLALANVDPEALYTRWEMLDGEETTHRWDAVWDMMKRGMSDADIRARYAGFDTETMALYRRAYEGTLASISKRGGYQRKKLIREERKE